MEATPAGVIEDEEELGMLPNLGAAAEVAPVPVLGGAGSNLGGGGGLGNVTATLARAGTVGSMSVPTGWAAPSSSPVSALSAGGVSTAELTGSGSTVPGAPGMPEWTASRATGVIPRYGVRITVMARPPAAG
jgi:PPE-repeat protein